MSQTVDPETYYMLWLLSISFMAIVMGIIVVVAKRSEKKPPRH